MARNLKAQLIRLGHQEPSLRKHLTPILDVISERTSQQRRAKDFKTWIREVDRELERKVMMGSRDLPDAPYRRYFNNGYSPKEAAQEALDFAGFGGMSF